MGMWEDCMRKLTRAKPQAFVDLMMDQLELERQVRYTGEYPRSEKLEASSFEVDMLLDVMVDEREESLIHFEWQAYYTNTMPERLLQYSTLVRCELKKPVLSCVWHMLNDTRIKPSPLYWTEPITGKVVEYHYIVIEIKDLLPEYIFGRGKLCCYRLCL
jgi:predicted transposase YdaD